jgi:hypothetical protein
MDPGIRNGPPLTKYDLAVNGKLDGPNWITERSGACSSLEPQQGNP